MKFSEYGAPLLTALVPFLLTALIFACIDCAKTREREEKLRYALEPFAKFLPLNTPVDQGSVILDWTIRDATGEIVSNSVLYMEDFQRAKDVLELTNP